MQPSYQLKELAKIGLFFKPDKCSILKVNARDYTWSFDTDNMTEGSWYIFPDPNKYGDIGNNKSADYPLVMTYKDTYDIRNLSSGEARDYPLVFLGDQNWRAYYSKSDDEFIQFDNGKFDYQFTKKIIGFSEDGNYSYPLQNYQMDMYGNQFAILSIETDIGEQTITFFDLDKIVNDNSVSYITRVKVEISDQLKRMGGAVLTITRGEEVVSLKLKNKKSYISFDCAFGEKYVYNINIRLGNKSVLDENQEHERKLPTEQTSVSVDYKSSYYTISTEFEHEFGDDNISKERY